MSSTEVPFGSGSLAHLSQGTSRAPPPIAAPRARPLAVVLAGPEVDRTNVAMGFVLDGQAEFLTQRSRAELELASLVLAGAPS